MGGWGHIEKTTKKYHKINIISTLTSPDNSLKNAMKVGSFFNVILNYLNLLLIDWRGRGVHTAHVGGGLLLVYMYNKITFFLLSL